MYRRDYQGKVLHFETSGGLVHSSLIFQDQETNTYWALMSGKAVEGNLKETRLVELPIGLKMKWKDWVSLYPQTKVLSIDGKEDAPKNVYERYFLSEEGFGGEKSLDIRLPTKEPIFAFHLNENAYAVSHHTLEGGVFFEVEKKSLFFYRPRNAELFLSTIAYEIPKEELEQKSGEWFLRKTQQPLSLLLSQHPVPFKRFIGFDTFWYNWSLNNPKTQLLK